MKDKTKVELRKELHDLQQKYDSLKALFDNGIRERKHSENESIQRPQFPDVISSVAKVGGWGFDTDTLKQTWTDEVYRIHELDFTFDPNVQNGMSFYAPQSAIYLLHNLKTEDSREEVFANTECNTIIKDGDVANF